jgi:hypothetical protein
MTKNMVTWSWVSNLSRRFGRWRRTRALIRHEYRVFYRNADDAALAAMEVELEILPTLLQMRAGCLKFRV